eukprot:403343638
MDKDTGKNLSNPQKKQSQKSLKNKSSSKQLAQLKESKAFEDNKSDDSFKHSSQMDDSEQIDQNDSLVLQSIIDKKSKNSIYMASDQLKKFKLPKQSSDNLKSLNRNSNLSHRLESKLSVNSNNLNSLNREHSQLGQRQKSTALLRSNSNVSLGVSLQKTPSQSPPKKKKNGNVKQSTHVALGNENKKHQRKRSNSQLAAFNRENFLIQSQIKDVNIGIIGKEMDDETQQNQIQPSWVGLADQILHSQYYQKLTPKQIIIHKKFLERQARNLDKLYLQKYPNLNSIQDQNQIQKDSYFNQYQPANSVQTSLLTTPNGAQKDIGFKLNPQYSQNTLPIETKLDTIQSKSSNQVTPTSSSTQLKRTVLKKISSKSQLNSYRSNSSTRSNKGIGKKSKNNSNVSPYEKIKSKISMYIKNSNKKGQDLKEEVNKQRDNSGSRLEMQVKDISKLSNLPSLVEQRSSEIEKWIENEKQKQQQIQNTATNQTSDQDKKLSSQGQNSKFPNPININSNDKMLPDSNQTLITKKNPYLFESVKEQNNEISSNTSQSQLSINEEEKLQTQPPDIKVYYSNNSVINIGKAPVVIINNNISREEKRENKNNQNRTIFSKVVNNDEDQKQASTFNLLQDQLKHMKQSETPSSNHLQSQNQTQTEFGDLIFNFHDFRRKSQNKLEPIPFQINSMKLNNFPQQQQQQFQKFTSTAYKFNDNREQQIKDQQKRENQILFQQNLRATSQKSLYKGLSEINQKFWLNSNSNNTSIDKNIVNSYSNKTSPRSRSNLITPNRQSSQQTTVDFQMPKINSATPRVIDMNKYLDRSGINNYHPNHGNGLMHSNSTSNTLNFQQNQLQNIHGGNSFQNSINNNSQSTAQQLLKHQQQQQYQIGNPQASKRLFTKLVVRRKVEDHLKVRERRILNISSLKNSQTSNLVQNQ